MFATFCACKCALLALHRPYKLELSAYIESMQMDNDVEEGELIEEVEIVSGGECPAKPHFEEYFVFPCAPYRLCVVSQCDHIEQFFQRPHVSPIEAP